MIEFLNLEWFSRIWIVQEVAMSSNVQVRFAGWTYDWDSLVSVLIPLLEAPDMAGFLQVTQRGRRAVGQLNNLHTLRQMQTTMIMVSAYRSVKKSSLVMNAIAAFIQSEETKKQWDKLKDFKSPTPLGKLLEKFREFKATDPRDRVYALLGLMGDDIPQSLTPRYGPDVTVQQVFLNATRYVLREPDHGLFVLAFAGTGYAGRLGGLPSWVPDWTNPPTGAPLTSYQWDKIPCDYAASGVLNISTFGNDDDTAEQLSLQCIRADEIALLSRSYERIANDEFVKDENGQFFHAAEFAALHEWHTSTVAMAQKRVLDPYPFKPGQSFKEAFWRTLVGDFHDMTRPALEYLGGVYDKWVALHEELMLYCNSAGPASLPTDDAFWHRIHETGTFGNAIGGCISSRSVCVTRDGYLGCVPSSARIGDEIFVLIGSQTPFVVRQAIQKGKYEIIGECYMHGMMDGEVLERETKRETLSFI